jgi:osmotically-inducible protein OsmY
MNRPIRSAALVGALAAVAATAWAANTISSADSFYPGAAAQARSDDAAAAPSGVVPVEDSLSPNETVVPSEGAASLEHATARKPLIVEERRMSEDERLQSVVMDRLARSNLTGKIGVESHDSVVTLTGWTSTVGQADRAGRYARGVTGVRYVENLIRPRVGGMVSS